MGIVKNILYRSDFVLSNIISFNKSVFPYYHAVSNDEIPHIKHLYKIKSIAQFKSDLDFLLKTYSVLSPDEFVRRITNNETIPPKHFLLTFDDGLSEIYDFVIPILEQKGIPSILFVNSDYIGNSELFYKHKISLIIEELKNLPALKISSLEKIANLMNVKEVSLESVIRKVRVIQFDKVKLLDELLQILEFDVIGYLSNEKPYLTIDELISIRNKGHYIGGHTTRHYPMDKLAFENQVDEVCDSISWIKDNLKIDYNLFSFPFSDAFASKELFKRLFLEIPNLICMGNAGFKKDISGQIVQRISFENPKYSAEVIFRNGLAYYYFNKLIFNGRVKRK